MPQICTDHDDTDGKFVTSVNDACGKFADLLAVSVTLVVDSDNNISLHLEYFRIFAKIFAKTIFATMFAKAIPAFFSKNASKNLRKLTDVDFSLSLLQKAQFVSNMGTQRDHISEKLLLKCNFGRFLINYV